MRGFVVVDAPSRTPIPQVVGCVQGLSPEVLLQLCAKQHCLGGVKQSPVKALGYAILLWGMWYGLLKFNVKFMVN